MSKTRTITAKFNSQCPKCLQAISAGTLVRWSPGSKAEHVACPTSVDMEFELSGEVLRQRYAAVVERLEAMDAIAEDWRSEQAGPEPTRCSCHGTGLTSTSVDYADTMDYTDRRNVEHTCGTALNVEWDAVARWPKFPTRQTEPNPTCQKREAEWKAWRARRVWAEENVPGLEQLKGLARLARWAKEDLRIRRGDVATVVNRSKEYTGPVVWVGEVEKGPRYTFSGMSRAARVARYGTEMRVKVAVGEDAKGGSMDTAKLVTRTIKVNASNKM